MPSKKSAERNLPATKNEPMIREMDAVILSSKCRVQDVRFGAADQEGTTETFVRIKTMHPQTKSPHFIMRKARDDYISATSMFRAVFHEANDAEEYNEMEVVKRELAARADENASGVWIPGTPDALQLADVYGIRSWVQALLDAPTEKSAYEEDRTRSPSSAAQSSSPHVKPESSLPIPETPSRKAGRGRSASPRKTIVASARKTKKSAKSIIDSISEDVKEATDAARDSIKTTGSQKLESLKEAVDRPISVPGSVTKAVESAKSILKDEITTNGDTEPSLFSTTVTAAGQSMADMVATARAQVEAAEKKDAAALTESGLSSTKKRRPAKRQVKEVSSDDKETSGDADIKDQAVSVKRSRVEDLEVGLVQEKRKVRALFGLVIGLGATAILPYLL